MSLRLSNADISALERAIRALLTPFSFENGEKWRLAAGHAVRHCLGGDAVSFGMSVGSEPFMAADQDVAGAMMNLVPPPDWLIRGLSLRRHQLGVTAIGWDDAFDLKAVRSTTFYNDVARPQRLLAPLLLVSDLTENGIPTTLAVMFNDEESAARHSYRRKQLLRLLSPAFEAGVGAYFGFYRHRAALRALSDHATVGVVHFDTRDLAGTENEFFRVMMESEPQRDRVRAEVARLIRGVLRSTVFDGAPSPDRRTNLEIQTAVARYRIAGHLLDDPAAPRFATAVALVDRLECAPLDTRALGAQFSLTRREIETAQLLRRGLSTRDIARELRISIHTARRHIERVMLKMDVHTRAAAAAKLAGTRD